VGFADLDRIENLTTDEHGDTDREFENHRRGRRCHKNMANPTPIET